MAITLVTGVPGSGKTARIVDLLAFSDEFKGRPLFTMGIPDLTLEHFPVPPVEEWTERRASPEDPSLLLDYFTFPPNAVIVIDEAQRVYRPRAASAKVPAEVAAFETHRHTGVDFILATQHPNLLDSNIRKLVGRHIHVHVHYMGRDLIEWPRCGDPDSSNDRALGARTRYKPPKRVFDMYKSSELHTKIKRTIPRYVWLLLASVLMLVAVVWYFSKSFKAKVAPDQKPVSAAHSGLPGAGAFGVEPDADWRVVGRVMSRSGARVLVVNAAGVSRWIVNPTITVSGMVAEIKLPSGVVLHGWSVSPAYALVQK